MYPHAEWQCFVKAPAQKAAERVLGRLAEALATPIRVDRIEFRPSRQAAPGELPLSGAGLFLIVFRSPLGFENPWQAFYHASRQMARLASRYRVMGPYVGDPASSYLEACAAEDSILVADVTALQCWVRNDPDHVDPGLRRDHLAELEADGELLEELRDHRAVAEPHLARLLAELAESGGERGGGAAPALPAIDSLFSGCSLLLMEPRVQASVAVAALERAILTEFGADHAERERLHHLVHSCRCRSLRFAPEEVVLLLRLTGALLDPQVDSTCGLPWLALEAATAHLQSRSAAGCVRGAAIELLGDFEKLPHLYLENAAALCELRRCLIDAARPGDNEPPRFSAIDQLGDCLNRQGGALDRAALDLFAAVPVRRGRASRWPRWNERCDRLLAESPAARATATALLATLQDLAAGVGSRPVLALTRDGVANNERLLRGALFASARGADPDQVAGMLAQIALRFEEEGPWLAAAAAQALKGMPAWRSAAALAELARAARGAALRRLAEQALWCQRRAAAKT